MKNRISSSTYRHFFGLPLLLLAGGGLWGGQVAFLGLPLPLLVGEDVALGCSVAPVCSATLGLPLPLPLPRPLPRLKLQIHLIIRHSTSCLYQNSWWSQLSGGSELWYTLGSSCLAWYINILPWISSEERSERSDTGSLLSFFIRNISDFWKFFINKIFRWLA